jgi:hypothetical protein
MTNTKDNRHEYTKGFRAGMEHTRNDIIKFLEDHSEDKDLLTLAEVIAEIRHWQKQDSDYNLRAISDGELWTLPLPLASIETRLAMVDIQIATLGKIVDEIENQARELVEKWQD